MVSGRFQRWILYGMLLGMLAGCGRMLPPGGRNDLIKYTVIKGDTLYSISWRYGYDHREVAAWNGIKPPYNIYPGQRILLIPPYKREPRTGRVVASTTSASRAKRNSASSVDSNRAKSKPAATRKKLEKRHSSHKQRRIVWQWPSKGMVVAGFNPAKGKKGLDLRGRVGQDVVAAAGGNVVYSGSGLIGYGKLIIIKHDDTYLSAYGHNRRLLVKEGDNVKQGEKIGEMGDSGKEGVMLHFEIRRDGKPVNPLSYLPKRKS